MTYKFLIYISYSYAIPIGTPLENEILKQGFKVKWFSDEEEGKLAIPKKSDLLDNIHNVISYKPDIVLTITDNVPDFITGIKVQIFHGFFSQKRPEKTNNYAHFRIRGFFDLYCTQGPSTTTIFKQIQSQKKHFEVIETGWSKVDPLFPIEKPNNNKATILIASTFTKRLSLAYNNEVFDEIKKLSIKGDYNFIMTLHPKLPLEIKEKWISLNNKNFTYVNTTDLIPLFKSSDILFADTTSVIQEFLLQNKIVITYNHTFNHDYLINITSTSEIESSIKKAIKQPNILEDEIKIFINNLHPYFDGQSSKRVINAAVNFLHKDKAYLKNKPFNFIRKFKIRKQLKYFTLKSYNDAYFIPKNNK